MSVKKKKIDDLNLQLTVDVQPEDYAPISKKKFAERKRTADFKGFRKGMVPASLIQRVYGEQILVESVNEVVSKSLDEYISSQKLHILGEPLGSEKQPEIEWKDGNAFTFIFDVALAPEVSLEVAKSDEVPSYTVTVSAKDKAPMIENMKKYYAEQKEKNPDAEAKSDDDIEKEVAERMKEQYRQESEWRLSKDIRDYFVKKAGLKLPEDFLKRWLVAANDGKYSKEDVEKEFPGFAEDFKWQMVRGYLMDKFGFKVEQKDITDAAEAYVTYQYAMYGIGNVPADMVKDAVNNVLSDRRQVERLVEQVEDRKVLEKLKEEITIKPTKITAAKFREL